MAIIKPLNENTLPQLEALNKTNMAAIDNLRLGGVAIRQAMNALIGAQEAAAKAAAASVVKPPEHGKPLPVKVLRTPKPGEPQRPKHH